MLCWGGAAVAVGEAGEVRGSWTAQREMPSVEDGDW